MNRRKTKNQLKKPVNLTLSTDAIRKGNDLKVHFGRPSFSNTVEFLIEEKDKQLALAAKVA